MPKIENDQFAIFLKASADGRILDGLAEGYITFPTDVPVTVLTRKMELYTLKVYSRQKMGGELSEMGILNLRY